MTRFVGTPLRGIEFSSPSDEAISARVVSDAHARLRIDAGGRLTWSSGSATGDVNLYRYDINVLKTDDNFQAAGGLTTVTTTGVPTVASPDGTIAVDTTNDVFYFRSGGEWLEVSSGANVVISSTEPVGAESGDLWFDSDTLVLYILNGATWVSVSGSLTLSELDDVSITSLETGHVLKYDGTNWINDLVDSAYTAHTEVVGDGTTKDIVVTHNFGTRDIVVQCRNASSPYESVEVGWEATSLNTVTLKFAVAPTASSIRANIYAGIGAQGTNAFSQNVGNGTDTSFVLTHNFNTRDVVVSARNVASPYEVVEINWQATTVNTVTAIFSVPPASGAVRVTVYAGGGVAGVTSIIGTANEVEVSASTGTVQVGLPSDVSLSGAPTAPTASPGTNTTQIATTAFVQNAVGSFATNLDGLSDVVITAPEEFQVLEYDGTNWVNKHASVVSYVRNAEATTLTTGTVVYLFGSTGDHATVKRADNNSDATSSKTVGVVGANIAAGQNGPVITRGYVDGINLSTGYAAGDVLWLGENGAFTTTKPTAPDHLVFVGVVVRATNNGIIYVATQNGYELDELHNVSLPSPSAGQYLKYDGSLWVADTIELGTDTTGNYVSGITAGTGVTVTHTPGEGSSPTVAIGQSVGTSDSVEFYSARVTRIYSPLSGMGETRLQFATPTLDRIITFPDASGTVALLGSIALGTDTTGNYVSDVTGGTGVTVTHTPGEGSSPSIAIGQAVGTTDNVTFAGATAGNIKVGVDNDEHISTTGVFLRLTTSNATPNAGGSKGIFLKPATNESNDYSAGQPLTLYGGDAINTNTVGGAIGGDVNIFGGQGSGGENNSGGNVNIDAGPAGNGFTADANGIIHFGDYYAESISIGRSNKNTTVNGHLIVSGNFTVNGTTTTLNTATLAVEDNIVKLNSNVTGTPTLNAGIEVERGDEFDVSIQWNETSDKWSLTNDGVNSYPILTTNNVLNDINDVTITSVSNGQFLKWNGSAWVNDSIPTINALDDIGDVTITSPSNGQVLKYNGTTWVNDTDAQGTTINALNDIGDVTITSVQVGEVVKWNGTAWVNDLETGYNNAHAEIIGNGSSTTFVLTHNFGTRDIFVQCRNNASPYENINVRWEATTEDTVTLDFSVAPASNSVRVNIYASVGVVGPSAYSQTIGDGTNVDYVITHNMQTRDVVVSARNTASPYEVIDINWEATSTNAITAKFQTPPSSNSIRVSVYAAAGVAGVTSIQGTANEIEVSGSTGGVTVGLPTNVTVTGSMSSSTLFVDSIEVDTTGATNGQFLGFNGTKFLPTAIPTINTLDDVGDVTITSVAAGQFIKWNGSAWVNDAIDLSADTTGNYVASLVAGTGVTLTNNTGEGATPTVSIGQAVGTGDSVTFASAVLSSSSVSPTLRITQTGTGYALLVEDSLNPDATPFVITADGAVGIGTSAPTTALDVDGVLTVRNASYLKNNVVIQGSIAGSLNLYVDGRGSFGVASTDSTTALIVRPIMSGEKGIVVKGIAAQTANLQEWQDSTGTILASISSSGNLTVLGDLTVNGTTTTLNTAELLVEDNIITLNSGVTGAPALNAGIEIERGTADNVQIRWNESTDKWQFTNDGTTYKDLGSGGVTVSDTAPSSPATGDMWYESDTGSLFAYYDSSWVEIGPGAVYDQIIGSIQAKGDLLVGTASQTLGRLAVGSNGTRLTANSATSTGVAWVSDATNTVIDAKGDLLVGTAADTITRLAVGSNGQYLVADSNQAAGVGWVSQNTRNLLYNGAMQVAQRGTSGTIGTSANGTYHSLDRWCVNLSNGGDWAMYQAPGNDSAGFSKSLQMYTNGTTPKTSAGYCFISQKLEGQDLQLIRKGTANAQQLTLSFWVKVAGYSQMTGTYIVELQDTDNNRHCSQAYTISSLGSWEYKTVTFPADTVGALTNDNNESLRINFWLYAGSDYRSGSLATSWANLSNGNRAVGQTDANYGGMANISFTGVQLNVGPVAAPFEFKSYVNELAECQRYYYAPQNAGGAGGDGAIIGTMGYAYSTTSALCPMPLPVPMRQQPQIAVQSGLEWARTDAGANVPSVGLFTSLSGNHYITLDLTGMSGLTVQMMGWLRFGTASTGSFAVSAEL